MDNRIMKTINVVCAVIHKDTVIFATQRGYGDYKDWWEFPGGKIEPNESPEGALKREIFEELRTSINIEQYINTVEYDYPIFHLSMKCYVCSILEGSLELLEHESARWLPIEDINSIDWLPADKLLIPDIVNYILKNKKSTTR